MYKHILIPTDGSALSRKAIEAVWRIEAARLIGGLVRLVRDVDKAEDLAQEALLTALERWPETGIPANPGAWLMTTAKHRAVDEVMEEGLDAYLADVQSRIATVSDEVIRTYLTDEPQPGRLVAVARAALLMAAQQQQ